jgi:hypothetical protein
MRVLVGILTLITAGIGLVSWFFFRTYILRLFLVLDVDPWSWRWWDSLGIVLLTMIWLIFVYLSAYFYQKALEKGRFWRLFGAVTMTQCLLPALAELSLRIVTLGT